MDKIEVCDNLEQDGGELRSQFWWQWKDSNGRILATSETYTQRATALRMAKRAWDKLNCRHYKGCKFVDLTNEVKRGN